MEGSSSLLTCCNLLASLSVMMCALAGMLKVPGLMPPRCKMFDTPGVPHAHQLSSRLDPEEVSAVLIWPVSSIVQVGAYSRHHMLYIYTYRGLVAGRQTMNVVLSRR